MLFLKNLKIKTKLLISFGIIIIFSIILAVVGIITVVDVRDNYDYILSMPQNRLSHLEGIKTEFMTMRYRCANLVMNSGDLDFINNTTIPQYNAARKSLFEDLEEFLEHNDEDTRQDPQIKKKNNDDAVALKGLMEEYDRYTDQVIAMARADDAKAADSVMKEAIPLSGNINALIDGLFSPAERFIEEITESTNKSEARAVVFLIILTAVLVLFALILAFSIGNSISRPIIRLREAAEQIAGGDLDINLASNARDEIGELTRDLGTVADTINRLIGSLGMMAKEQEKGDMDAKIDASCFRGSYKAVAEGINNMMGAAMDQNMMFMNCITEFGNGNFNADIPQQPGKKAVMNHTLNEMRKNLKSVSSDMGVLIDSAFKGDLSKRADVAKYKGDWAELLNVLNKLMWAITVPINEVAEVMQEVSKGNFNRQVTGDYHGEFLMIKGAVNETVINVASYIDEISGVLGAVANDNLDQYIKRDYVGKFSDIKNALNNIIDKLNIFIADISSASEQVSAAARQVSESSMTLSQGATEQASSIEELNATILTINESTGQNAENAKEAEDLSASSKDNAVKGNKDMDNMLVSMDGIKESSNNISKIIKAIDDIAFQTNLLALNAAVEAARAGVHGKGFAVVAEEVRSLAARSQNAAKETANLIEESINRVNEGTKIAGTTANALRTIVDDVSKVAHIITGIATASHEQALSVSQVTEGLTQITEVVQNNSAISEESASAAQELSSQAEVMKNMVSVFKLRRS